MPCCEGQWITKSNLKPLLRSELDPSLLCRGMADFIITWVLYCKIILSPLLVIMFYYTSYHLMLTGASGAPDLAAADIFSAAVLKAKRSRAMSKFHKVVLFYSPAFFLRPNVRTCHIWKKRSNNGSDLFKYPSKSWQWASMHSTMILKLKHWPLWCQHVLCVKAFYQHLGKWATARPIEPNSYCTCDCCCDVHTFPSWVTKWIK